MLFRSPDDDAFQADITAIPPLIQRGSRGKWALPSRDEIIKLLGRSADVFSALGLTFAYPVHQGINQRRIHRVALDTRRPGSPLSAVRDFNNIKSKTHTASFEIK